MDVHFNDGTISVFHGIYVIAKTYYDGSHDKNLLWNDPSMVNVCNSTPYSNSQWSYAIGYPGSASLATVYENYYYQRPALKIQQYSKISILIIISAEEIKKPLKIFYL